MHCFHYSLLFFFFPILTCKTYISHAFKAISISWKSSWWVQCWERHIKTSFISETVKIVFTYTTLHWVRDHLLQLLWLLDACIFFLENQGKLTMWHCKAEDALLSPYTISVWFWNKQLYLKKFYSNQFKKFAKMQHWIKIVNHLCTISIN